MINGKKDSGSLTLEAAIMVPMFIMLMLMINGVFVMFMGRQIMTHTLIQSAKSLAFDPYSSQRVAANADDQLAELFTDLFSFVGDGYTSTATWYEDDYSRLTNVVEDRYVAYLKENNADAEKLLDQIGIKNGLNGLDFSGTTIENGVLKIELKYTQEYIFNVFDFAEFGQELVVSVKLFEY